VDNSLSVPSLCELVAANVARLCTDAKVPVQRVADTAAGLGLDWTRAWMTGLPHVAKPLAGEHLLLLPIVMSEALAQQVSLADLLVSDEPITLGEVKVAPADLREAVTAIPYQRPFGTVEHTPSTNEAELAIEKARLVREANLGDLDVRTLESAEAGAGEAESRLSQRLGVADIVVVAAAASLWGQSLSQERDALVRAGRHPAAVLRGLSAAIAARIRAAAQTGTPNVAV
jgi:hypothetical protein